MADLLDAATIERVQAKNREQIEKAAALDQVASNSGKWMSDFAQAARSQLSEKVGVNMLGEDIRKLVVDAGLRPPHSPNAWGSAVTLLKRRNVIAETGRWLAMRSEGSHARRSPEYIVLSKELWR
jgi:hypothetical protein